MLRNPLVQIAGVKDLAEAELLQHCGVRYIGFPLRLPVHTEDLSEAETANIIQKLDSRTTAVLITYLKDAMEILEFCRFLGVRMVQLHGDIHRDELSKLKSLDPNVTVIKSLIVGLHSEAYLKTLIQDTSAIVDAYILDSYDPKTGASGATGRTHDWAISRQLVEFSGRPVILAGGLTPENVREAIRRVKPAGVDSHSGVEDSTGRKSFEKVNRFLQESDAAFDDFVVGTHWDAELSRQDAGVTDG